MPYIDPSITDKGLISIRQKVNEIYDLSNLPKFTTKDGLTVQKPYTNFVLKAIERLNLVYGFIDMKYEYNYRPDYVAYDYYGTTNLYWFVLYTNQTPSIMDFTVNKIKKLKIYRKEDVDLLFSMIENDKI
ncbi:MAG: hypothetical protein QW806_09230 [Nitrososphaerota archaeon]